LWNLSVGCRVDTWFGLPFKFTRFASDSIGHRGSTPAVVVAIAPTPPPSLVVPMQEVAPIAVEVSAPATSASPVVASLSTIVAALLSVGVTTTSAPVMSPPASSAPPIPPSAVLVLALTSTSFHPHVSLDHIYTSSNVDSLRGIGYKPKQKTLVGFVLAFDKNLIQSTRV